MSQKTLFIFTLATVISLTILAACGSAPAGNQPDASAFAQGKALFATNCGECHGNDGSGSDEAPAVAGHSLDQVKTQVRTPEGDMKPIDPSKLSDADLQIIAEWVASLPGEEAHPDLKISDEERTHLTAAYEAIQDYENMDTQTAIDHLNQASALASGDAADFYDEMIESIQTEKAGNARHELSELLGMEMEQ